MRIGFALCLPLLLVGCSSWWGSNSVIDNEGRWIISDAGVGPITAKTQFKQSELQKAFGDNFKVIEGMEINSKKLSHFFNINTLDNNNTIMKIIGETKGNIEQIETQSDQVTHQNIHVGSYFHQLYKQAITGNCRKINNEEAGVVLCDSPKSKHIHYIFNGQSDDFDSLLPPNDELMDWKITKIIWLAKTE